MHTSVNETGVNKRYTYGIGNRLSELFEAQFTIAVLVRLHNSFVNNLLKLLVLKKLLIENEACLFIYTNLQVISNHHLQH